MLTRRDTAKLLIASTAALAMPIGARAANAAEWQAAMEQAVQAATVQGSGTNLTLVGFGFGRNGDFAGFSATVRMDWPPGVRKRRFNFTDEGERETFGKVVTAMVTEFRRVNPNGVREVRLR